MAPAALGIQAPQINALGSFQQGVEARQNMEMGKVKQAQAAIENIGSMALGVMGGKMDGPPDPQRWEQALDMLGSQGMDVSAFRGKANMAPVVARASMSTLQQLTAAQNEAEMDMRVKEFTMKMSEAAKGTADWSKLDDNTLFNERTGATKDMAGAAGAGGFRFGGSSVEAQSLNGLIDSGQLTVEEAQQLGAGKTITGPNGEIIFMTPQGLMGKPAGGGEATPINPAGGDASLSQPVPTAPKSNAIQLTEPKTTVDEKEAMTFADRMTVSGKIIEEMGTKGSGQYDKTASSIPGVAPYLTTDDFKKVDQAKRDFINAQLRRESGAVISPEEFDNANKQYFPQPNDPPDVLEQKRVNRETVTKGMQRASGPTYTPPKTDGADGWQDLGDGVRIRVKQ